MRYLVNQSHVGRGYGLARRKTKINLMDQTESARGQSERPACRRRHSSLGETTGCWRRIDLLEDHVLIGACGLGGGEAHPSH
jgi:hypothetical protein